MTTGITPQIDKRQLGIVPSEPSWRIVAESVQGVSHEKTNTPCQDAYCGTIFQNLLLVAVADGAGSALMSEIGSEIAVNTAINSLKIQLIDLSEVSNDRRKFNWEIILRKSLTESLSAIEDQANKLNRERKDLATTLLLAVSDGNFIAAMQIGDGAVVIGDEDGNISTLTTPQKGEYVNTTTFITSTRAMDVAQYVAKEQRISHIAVFTDGVEMLALEYPRGTAYRPFFEPLFEFIDNKENLSEDELKVQLRDFLESPQLRSRTHDDLTISLAAFC